MNIRKMVGRQGKSASLLAGLGFFLMGIVVTPSPAQDAKTPYPKRAPLGQYYMEDRASEIALAQSAAPQSIAHDAEVLVLGKQGYEKAVSGKNGFVCMVLRSWTAGFDDPEFWNPKLRGPICLNPPAVHSYLPYVFKRTDLVLAGQSKEQISEAIHSAVEKKELPGMDPGALGYMLSKQGYLSDRGGHWHPHLMFYLPLSELAAWGANLPGSPILGSQEALERMTVFLVPVHEWSDGTADHE